MQKANKIDINGEDIYVGDKVTLPDSDEEFEVKYGNYSFIGTSRTGYYIQGRETLLNNQLPLTNNVEKIKNT